MKYCLNQPSYSITFGTIKKSSFFSGEFFNISFLIFPSSTISFLASRVLFVIDLSVLISFVSNSFNFSTKVNIESKSFDNESEKVDVDDNEEIEEQVIKEEHDEDKGEDGDGNDNDEVEDLFERTTVDEGIDVEIGFFLLLTFFLFFHLLHKLSIL